MSRIRVELLSKIHRSKYAKIVFLDFFFQTSINQKTILIELKFKSFNICNLLYAFDSWITILTSTLRLYKLQICTI